MNEAYDAAFDRERQREQEFIDAKNTEEKTARFAEVEILVQRAIDVGKRGTDVPVYTAKGITYDILRALGEI